MTASAWCCFFYFLCLDHYVSKYYLISFTVYLYTSIYIVFIFLILLIMSDHPIFGIFTRLKQMILWFIWSSILGVAANEETSTTGTDGTTLPATENYAEDWNVTSHDNNSTKAEDHTESDTRQPGSTTDNPLADCEEGWFGYREFCYKVGRFFFFFFPR